jgi:hypothetical protein
LFKTQVNKFKVQLAVVIDLPLTILNLWVLWSVDTTLITNPIFLISLILAVFNAGKISTLIEYHLELRQRMRKLAHLLSLELHKEKDRPSASKISKVPSPLLLEEVRSQPEEQMCYVCFLWQCLPSDHACLRYSHYCRVTMNILKVYQR